MNEPEWLISDDPMAFRKGIESETGVAVKQPYRVRVTGYVPGGASPLRADTLRLLDVALGGWRLEVVLSRVP